MLLDLSNLDNSQQKRSQWFLTPCRNAHLLIKSSPTLSSSSSLFTRLQNQLYFSRNEITTTIQFGLFPSLDSNQLPSNIAIFEVHQQTFVVGGQSLWVEPGEFEVILESKKGFFVVLPRKYSDLNIYNHIAHIELLVSVLQSIIFLLVPKKSGSLPLVSKI